MALICGAEREITLDVGVGDSGGDTFISAVNSIPTKSAIFEQEKHWIGGSGRVLIAKCRRCVGNRLVPN